MMNNLLLKKFVLFLLLIISTTAIAETVYKYKNAQGKWVFSDQPPPDSDDFEEKEYKTKTEKVEQPQVFIRELADKRILMVKNPFYAPIEVEINSPFCSAQKQHLVVPARQTSVGCETVNSDLQANVRYRWALGAPTAQSDGSTYAIPMKAGLERRITQSFRGRFSHSQEPSLYAVDIAMPVGTDIAAARSGIVVFVKDDYHMGGSTQFFLDKANYVRILHDDGTFADYAHILMGTATVKPGEQVKTGDVIARSGSSGFSTGPHLHFVIRRNTGFNYQSVKFVFVTDKGRAFTPQAGMMVQGY